MKRPNFRNLTFDASPNMAVALRRLREANLNLTDSDVCRTVLLNALNNERVLDDAYLSKEALFSDVSQERFSRANRNISYCFRVSETLLNRVDAAVAISDYPSRSVFLYCLFGAYLSWSHAVMA